MKRLLSTLLALAVACLSHAFTREEIKVRSRSMDKDIPVTVVVPDGYESKHGLPAVYMLHGFGDDYRAWSVKGHADSLADIYDAVIVMPDGGFDSWYFDSPVDPSYRYETFVTAELIPYIDSHYKTDADRRARAITGLSMGGHGALYLAIRHQDLFGAAGSISGGVDIRPFPDNWGISKRLGTIDEHPENWENNTVINMTGMLAPHSLRLVIDCGMEDFFLGVNCALHDKLSAEGIPHDFYQRPGAHNWDYWSNAIQYQMLFFGNWFRSRHASHDDKDN